MLPTCQKRADLPIIIGTLMFDFMDFLLMIKRLPWWLIGCLFVTITTIAQDDTCLRIFQEALNRAGQVCDADARNTLCYVHGSAIVNAIPNRADFAREDDTLPLNEMITLDTGALNPDDESWGFVVARLRANLPEIPATDALTMFIMGAVQLENTNQIEALTVDMLLTRNANARQFAFSNSALTGSFTPGQRVLVDGRNREGSWLQIFWQDDLYVDQINTGWVFTEQLAADVNPMAFDLYDDQNNPQIPERPMQVMNFASGEETSDCNEQPPNGILMQSPENAGDVVMRINGVFMRIDGTVFLSAQAAGRLRITVLEGDVFVESLNARVTVPAGAMVTVPLNADLQASAPPSLVQPYDAELVENLPLTRLPRAITPTESFTAAELLVQRLSLLPADGQWELDYDIDNVKCPWGTTTLRYNDGEKTITFTDNGDALNFLGEMMSRTGASSFRGELNHIIYDDTGFRVLGTGIETYTLFLRDSTLIDGVLRGLWTFPDVGACPFTNTFTLRYVGN